MCKSCAEIKVARGIPAPHVWFLLGNLLLTVCLMASKGEAERMCPALHLLP